MLNLNSVFISGKEVLPLVDGGKGINATDGFSAGAWAKENAVGTFSGISPDYFDENGTRSGAKIFGKTRLERQRELIEQAVKGAIDQAKIAYEKASGSGRIHINILWESGGSQEIMERVLENAKGMINGVVSGAGMPYKMAEIASKFETYYYSIVSSARAFNALWLRSYKKFSTFLGGVIYEDPWLAGGHNGLSNSENPNIPESMYKRVLELRQQMTKLGIASTIPIIVAGGIWSLSEMKDFIDNQELGSIAFQFGTRSLVTTESPISDAWKQKMFTLNKGDIKLQTLSPTGFYSSAVHNAWMQKMEDRISKQLPFTVIPDEEFNIEIETDNKAKVFVKKADFAKISSYKEQDLTKIFKTPDNTLVFLNNEDAEEFKNDLKTCSGCLSECRYSSWSQIREGGVSGKIPDPRTFCIHKSLMKIGHGGSVEDNIMFSGHLGYRFKTDPFYKDGFIPTTKELIVALLEGK